MPIVRAVVILPNINGVPKDHFTNTFMFNVDGVVLPDASERAVMREAIADVYWPGGFANNQTISGHLSPVISRVTPCRIKFYDHLAGGSPFAEETFGLGVPLSTSAVPSQVGLVASFHGDLTGLVEEVVIAGETFRPKAQRRGRLTIGPWNSLALVTTNQEPRPSSDVRGLVNAAMKRLADESREVGMLGQIGVTWGVWSGVGAGGFAPVVGGWCDDRLDTQRRRLSAPTIRTTWAQAA